MNTYKDLIIWKESIELIKEIYTVAEKLPKSEEYNLKQQLRRAVISVALNIAEGKSRRTAKDFGSFLTIFAASLAEVEAILTICEELGFLKDYEKSKEKIIILTKRINSLRNKLQGNNN